MGRVAFIGFLQRLAVCAALVAALANAHAQLVVSSNTILPTPLSVATLDPLGVIVANGVALTITAAGGGAVTNTTTLLLNSTGNVTDLILSGGTVTFSGGGSITLGSSANNSIFGASGSDILVNASGHTIQGAGSLGVNQLVVTNQGLIAATQSATPLIVDPSGTGLTNTGTLRATNNALLQLINGTFTNTGGLIEAQNGSLVDVSSSTITGGSLTTSGTGLIRAKGASTFSGVTVTSGSTLVFTNNSANNLAGTLTNNGSVLLNSAGNPTDVILDSAGVTFTGGGTVSLSNTSVNRLYGQDGFTTLTNLNNTIQGSGQFGANQLQLDNRSLIVANQTTPLVLDPSGTGVANTGTLRATNGATLQLTSGIFTNTGGLIEAQTGSLVDVSSATIAGGNLTTTGTGLIRSLGGVTFSNVTLTTGSTLEFANNTTTSLVGTLTNKSSVLLNSAGNTTDVILDTAGVTFTGGGTVSLSNTSVNRLYGQDGSTTLTNLNNTIQGSGQLGANQLQLDNRSLIVANQTTPLVIDPSGTGVANTGTLRATNGATLQLTSGTFTNTGGVIEAQTGSLVDVSSATIAGGTLASAGTGLIRSLGGVTLSGLTLTSGSKFQALNNTTTTLAGTITNQGLFVQDSIGNTTTVLLDAAGVTLTGGGILSLSNFTVNYLYGQNGSTTLTNLNHTIRGSGQLGANQLQITNQGIIESTFSGGTLTVDPSGTGVLNTGTMRAVNGGTLSLEGGTFKNFDNTSGLVNGLIQSQSGSNVVVASATVNGGNVEVGASGQLSLNSGTITGGTITNSSTGLILTTGGVSTLAGTLANPLGGTVQVGNNTSLTLLATGTYNNAGSFNMASVGNTTDLIFSGGDVTLSGSGTLTISNTSANRLYGSASTDRLINFNTIQGSGQVGLNLMGLVNHGIIVANESQSMIVDPSATGLVNDGALRADNNATLALQSGSFSNTGGTIAAITAGAHVSFSSAVVTGGTLTSAAGASLQSLGASSFDSITLTSGSLLDLVNSTATTFSGTIDNRGTIGLNSIGNTTDFIVGTGNVTLTGGGIVQLSNTTANRLYGASGTNSLNNIDNTIRGSGQLGLNQLILVNSGTIEANQSQPLTVDTSGTSALNTGTMQAVGGGTLQLQSGIFENTGGTIAAKAGSLVELSSATINHGIVSTIGTGELRLNGSTIAADTFTNSATGVVRNISGSSLISGNFTNPTGGTLVIDNNSILTFSAGAYQMDGSVNFNSVGNNTDFRVSGGDVTLNGTGTFTLSNTLANRIYGAAATDRLINFNTIQGSGQIGFNLLGLVNHGLIVANQPQLMLIDPSAAGVVNDGTLRATNGATLSLQSGSFTNTGGTIDVQAGSLVQFSGASVTGGSATIAAGGILQFDSSSFTGGTVTLAATGKLATASGANTLGGTVTNPVGGILQIGNSTSLTLLATGTYNNAGSFDFVSVGNSTDLILSGGDVTLAGSGTVTLSNTLANHIFGAATTDRLINFNTLQGSGQVGLNQMGLINHGLIVANQSQPLVIDPSAAGVTNDGTLRATDGATLSLQSGSFANTGGNITALTAGSHVSFSGTTVTGGTLTSAAGSSLQSVGGATFDSISLATGSLLELFNSTGTTLVGTIANAGTMQLNSVGNTTDLIAGTGGLTLTGGGLIQLSNFTANRFYGISGATVLNNVDNTIGGSGQLGIGQLTLLNTGTIEANQSQPLTVDLTNGAPFTNQGILRATSGGNLVFVDPLTNAGNVFVQSASTFTSQGTFTQSAGVTSLASGTFTAATATFQNGGVLQGSGTITGDVTNSGVIAPGDGTTTHSIGDLTFTHTLTFTPTSSLLFDLGGLTSGTGFDHVQAGAIALDGSLAVTFTNNFQTTILPGNTFTLLSTISPTGLTGTFAGLTNGGTIFTTDGFGSFQVNYLANSFTLSNFVPVPEPSTYALLGLGIVALATTLRRRRS